MAAWGGGFACRFQQYFTPLQEKAICHWSPAQPYIVAGENPLPFVPSTSLNCCRREFVFNGSQQDLAPLQERTLCDWFPARPYIVAGENPLPLVSSKALHRCRREPSAIGPQHSIKVLQGGTFFAVVPSKTLHRCRRESSVIVHVVMCLHLCLCISLYVRAVGGRLVGLSSL